MVMDSKNDAEGEEGANGLDEGSTQNSEVGEFGPRKTRRGHPRDLMKALCVDLS